MSTYLPLITAILFAAFGILVWREESIYGKKELTNA